MDNNDQRGNKNLEDKDIQLLNCNFNHQRLNIKSNPIDIRGSN